MALPTIGDYLTAQQTINPFAAQALQQATAGAGRSAEMQERAALAQLAMNPNVTQQASTPEAATTGQAATTGNVSRANLGNLGFSTLNALASQTPQIQYSPTNIEGGALGQGIANMFNIQQQRQSRDQILGLLQQQQQAQQAAVQQKAAAEAQQAQQQIGALSRFMSPEEAAGLVASGQGGTALAKLGELVGANVDVRGAGIRRQGVLDINPELGNAQPVAPASPVDVATAQEILPKFDQFGGVRDAAQAKIDLSKAVAEPQRQQLEIEGKQADVQAQQLANQFAPYEEQRKQEAAEIDRLTAEGKLQEAADKRAQLEQRDNFLSNAAQVISSATPEQREQLKLVGQMYGIDAKVFDKPKADKATQKVVKVGKNKYAQYNDQGQLELIDPKKIKADDGSVSFFGGLGTLLEGPIEVAPTAEPVAAVDVAPSVERQLRTQIQQAKPNSPEQRQLLEQLREINRRKGLQRATPIQGGGFDLQVPQMDAFGLRPIELGG